MDGAALDVHRHKYNMALLQRAPGAIKQEAKTEVGRMLAAVDTYSGLHRVLGYRYPYVHQR